MAGLSQPAVERLREFLRDLKPGARALLIAELERSLLRGDDFTGAELILTELRRSIRANQSTSQRIGDHARLFFQPLEPFLVDDAPLQKHRGRIARSSIEPIWLWLSSTIMSDEVNALSEGVELAMLSSDADRAEQLIRAFQDNAMQRIRDALAGADADDKTRRRIGVQIGTPTAIEDLQTLADVLEARDDLAILAAQLPGHTRNFSGSTLDSAKAQLEASSHAQPRMFPYALVLAMDRLAAPWQLIRLATKAAGSDAEGRIAETPYTLAVTIVLAETGRIVRELSADLKSGRGIAVAALLKDVHDAVRGLRTELDLSNDSPWGQQLTAIRADISKLVSAEINLMPGRVRRLMRPRPVKEIALGSTIDAEEVVEAESLIGFVIACRKYASELAINEITQRVFTELQQCLDAGTRALLDALRTAGDTERPFRQSQVDAAVRFCAKVFGQEYASLLIKAADVASHSERKTARA